MKRRNRTRLTLLLLSLLTVFVLATLAGCEEECAHEWTEASCESVKTCTLCGKTEGEALGHSWVDATCTSPKTCVACGKTEGDIAHAWVEATCTAPKTCTACSLTEGEALGHAWTEATCTTPKTCSTCSLTEGDALGHTWAEATCTTAKTCSVCATVEGEIPGHTWVKATCTTAKTCAVCALAEGEALGHTWTGADCVAPKTCSACGETEGKALGHDWKAATCETPKTCNRCGKIEGQAGHKWINATCEAAKTCSACGKTDGKALGHSYVDATCTTAKTCSRCKKTEGSALGHKWAEATCTTPKTCATCKTTEGSAKGHSYDKGVCTVCGNVDEDYVETINVEALTHKSQSISKITHSSTTVDAAVLKTHNGNITKINQVDRYSFVVPRNGIYRIEITNMKASTKVMLYIYNDLGEEIASNSSLFNNGEGLTVSLTANKTYTIEVREFHQSYSSVPTLGSYTLNIWSQKPTVDATNYTQINDSIEFYNQKNYYTFTPSTSGTHRIEITNMKASTKVMLYIYNDLGEEIASNSSLFNNGEGLTVSLTANKTYTIVVCNFHLSFENTATALGSYTLNIWSQKPKVDVTSKVQIKDSIQYKNQANIYNFTADVAGTHTVKITGLDSSVVTAIYVYNNLDEKVASDTSFKNKDTISLKNLEIGSNYRIVVKQSSGTGGYTLTIE